MNVLLRPTTFSRSLLIALAISFAFLGWSGASASDDSAPVVVVIGGGNTQTPTSTPPDEANETPTVPVVAQLPDTGVAGTHHPATTTMLLTLLTAGVLLTVGGLAGSRRGR